MPFLITCDEVSGCGHTYPGDMSQCPKCGSSSAFSKPAHFDPTLYGYDIEVYPNVFTCRVIHPETGTRWRFEISDRIDQTAEFATFIYALKNCGGRMVGFNNLNYDYPVIHFIVINSEWVTTTDIYVKSMSIIESPFGDYSHMVWESEHIVPQIDLIKIWHFQNKARATSLKALEIAMRMTQVQDLPYPPGTVLTHSQIDELHEYNDHDVVATCQFLARSLTAINLRQELSESLGLNLTNSSDVKMGEQILVAELEKAGIQCYDYSTGRRSPRQTWRGEIPLRDVIFPYIQLERPEFSMVLEWFKRQTIFETKGAFENMPVQHDMVQYMDPEQIKVHGLSTRPVKLSKVDPGTDISRYRLTTEKPHCVVNGLTYYFGTGGIHMSVESQILHSSDTETIVDVDVASYYPNLGIKNRLYPAHLGVEFCEAYEGVYKTRKSYKKDQPENGAFKLALNGAYGGSKSEFSPFYDPFYTMSITVNGQLLLCVLTEQLLKIPGLRMVQANTDGVTFITPNAYIENVRVVCRWWERLTCLELEEVQYSRMFIRDVNNYMAEKADGGKVKRIGAYAHERQDLNPATRESTYNKDPSALIVPMAAEAVLVRGEDVRQYITEHRDPYDFMIRSKVRRVDQLVMRYPELDGFEIEQQRTGRYYVSKAGGNLVVKTPPKGTIGTWKRKNGVSENTFKAVMAELNDIPPFTYPPEALDADGVPHDERIHTKNQSKYVPGESGLTVGWPLTVCNDVSDFDWSNLNYEYYIAEAKKLIDVLTKSSSGV